MISESQIRNHLLRRIYRIPLEKLKEISDFVSKIEEKAVNKPKVLSYAGAWKNLDDSVFQHLTRDLIKNRQRNKRRFNDQGID